MKGEVIGEIALVMSERDNVATALSDIESGTRIASPKMVNSADSISVTEDVPFGHKFALVEIIESENIYKYDEVIGIASTKIEPGEWVHVHNCESRRGRGDIATAKTNSEGKA